MARQKPEAAQNTWSDVAHAVWAWEQELGVRISAQIVWETRLSTGGAVEVVITEGVTVGRGAELVRVREAFPATKMTGQPGAVLWAVSCAIRCLEREPWLWSTTMRMRALRKP
jgi:hypothetical protein